MKERIFRLTEIKVRAHITVTLILNAAFYPQSQNLNLTSRHTVRVSPGSGPELGPRLSICGVEESSEGVEGETSDSGPQSLT